MIKILNLQALLTLLLLLSPFVLHAEIDSFEKADIEIQRLGKIIDKSPNNSQLYIDRGDLYFLTHDFDSAVEDYTLALEIDNNADKAYFGRGMALGRQGFIEEGIKDLSVFIKRNPEDSVAFTKRGVRYLWLGDHTSAYNDFIKAISIDPKNAEAHDDFGVVLALKGKYKKAIKHFKTTVSIEPSYQKAHHNLAMAYYITENDALALRAVDNSLKLLPEARDSILLKSKILLSLGKIEEAKELEEQAQFLPQSGDWSEHVPVQ